ncbi:MAG: GNAT family N-acetyltransferase, partial [Candidatus Heimdallarchaeota archaeon]
MENTTFKKFDPMTSSEVEWKQYHEFRRLKNKEVNPDDPISSDESVEKSIKANLQQTPEAEINLTNIIDDKSSKIIGDIMYAVITEQSPSYEGTKHLVQFDIYILKEHRQQGIGKQALKLVFDFA